MQVFKFGGASVKDAEGVKNVAEVLKQFQGSKICVVVSAMGKTTNSLERLTKAYFYKAEDAESLLEGIKKYHFDICKQLFTLPSHPIYTELENTFVELHWAIEDEPTQGFDFEYDQIVSMGEIISTKIVSAYLNDAGIKNKWMDVRSLIQTDNTYREGKVDFDLTETLVNKELTPVFDTHDIMVTQGFIGGTSENFTTTLGREGSDYTASILAYCLTASNVTIWKDVPGVLNADPKWFARTKKIDELSYHDAIELTYYGATVIHPKTIKPLQNKNIPLYVKSFLEPKGEGTVIRDGEKRLNIPSYIFKVDQVLVSIQPKDFSFIAEDNLSDIFELFSKHAIKINLMQLSAISFSVCCDHDADKIKTLVEELQEQFKVLYNSGLELMTVRYYTQDTIDTLTANKIILLEQRSRFTVQMVMKNEIAE
ncbi:MAG: aspartate kinase [Bacteroidetes bacterium]|jgi:aspartate kinase|nr:aspartate kinase [Bacteroidota bacterium]MDF2453957.1 aspartate kinase [Bacteroidota bacterium]